MKKFFTVLGALVAFAAAVAGGVFLYNKYKENKCAGDDDFDDDYDDDFSDDDDDDDEERAYVNISPESKEATEG